MRIQLSGTADIDFVSHPAIMAYALLARYANGKEITSCHPIGLATPNRTGQEAPVRRPSAEAGAS